MDKTENRSIGALVGLAIGNALGLQTVATPREALTRVVGMIGGGVYDMIPGDWGDAMAMAMATSTSLIKRKGFDATSVMSHWYVCITRGDFTVHGRILDSAQITRDKVMAFQIGEHPRMTPCDSRSTDCLARMAPISIMCRGKVQDCTKFSKLQTDLTQANEVTQTVGMWLANSMRLSIQNGSGKDAILSLSNSLNPKIGKWRDKPRAMMIPAANVVDAVKVVLWSIDTTNTFEEALITAVSLGGDSANIGAITGQLAGAIYGYDAIPARWLDQLAWKDYIVTTARELHRLSL